MPFIYGEVRLFARWVTLPVGPSSSMSGLPLVGRSDTSDC